MTDYTFKLFNLYIFKKRFYYDIKVNYEKKKFAYYFKTGVDIVYADGE